MTVNKNNIDLVSFTKNINAESAYILGILWADRLSR